MSISPLAELAMSKLSTWEELLSKKLNKYPDYYLEFRVLRESSNWSRALMHEIFQYSDQYPVMHQVLHNCWDYFESNFERVFPPVIQRKITEIARLAMDARCPNSQRAQTQLLAKLEGFKVPKGSCSYYRAVEEGFNVSFHILAAKSFNSEQSKKVLNLIGRIDSQADMTSCPALEKIRSLGSELKFDPQSRLEDLVKHLISLGENDLVEFKELLSLPRVPNEKASSSSKSIEDKTLKCIAAFLNSEGGHLLLGVEDNASLKGIEREVNEKFDGNYDKFLNHIQTIIKDRLGPDASRLTKVIPCSVDEKRIVVIDVTQANRPIELKGNFFIRKFARCEVLVGETREDYQTKRFST